MDKKLNKNQKLINNIIYFSFVFILTYMLGRAMPLELGVLKQMLSVIIISGIIEFFLLKPLFLYIILLIGFIASIIINHYFVPFIQPLLKNLYLLFENIIDYIMCKENLIPKNVFKFWWILIALVAIYTGFIIFKNKKIYFLLPVYIGTLVYYWYAFFDIAYFLIAIFLFLFLILLGLNKYSKEKIKSENFILKAIVLYSFLIITLSLLIPKSNNFIQWYWLQNTVYNIFPGIEDLRSSDEHTRDFGNADSFDFAETGYQRKATKLGGPIRTSDKKVMTVKGNGPFYLRGNIRHTYTGDMWQSQDNPREIYLSGEDFSEISEEDRKKYYTKNSIEITNHNFSSTTLFNPYGTNKVYLDGNYEIEVSPDGELQFPSGIYDGKSYALDILTPLPYDVLVSKGIDNKKKDIKKLSQYLQYPKFKITKNTKELAAEIVKDKETDYEKAVAIEKYLRKNYKYNTNVEKPPRNRDFIDYFLFESKEGYCTYYATTMAIMLRLEGIPSRYVEGFIARDLVRDGVYEVKKKNAHAWVEAFIEPVGWMIFEPTPQYPIVSRLEKPLLIGELNPIYEDERLINISDKSQLEDLNITKNKTNNNIKKDKDIDAINEEIPDTFTLENLPKNTPIIITGIVLLIVFMRFFISILKNKYRNAKIKKLPNKKRIIYQYNEILKLTKLLGYPIKQGETHYEYANRIAYRFSYMGNKGIQEITDIFVKNKYSEMPTSDEDLYEIEKFKENVENRAKNHLGSWKYWLNI